MPAKKTTTKKPTTKKTPTAKKTTATQKAEKTAVLKSEELLGGGFLSGLGFKKEETKTKHEEEETTTVSTSDIFDKSSEIIEEKPKKPTAGKPTFSFDVAQPKKVEYKPRNTTPQHGGHQGNKGGYQGNKPGYQGNKGGYQNNKGRGQVGGGKSKPAYPRPEAPKPQAKKVEKIATTSENLVKKVTITIEENITVKEFSEKMGVPLPEVLKALLQNKIMKSITASLDFDTASLIAGELGIQVKQKDKKLDVETFMSGNLQAILDLDKETENLQQRAPIVTVMGHVDHGKTSLLDYLRKTTVADGEAGGITQSIGASMIEHDGKVITFIDTPGHELFTNLRARGAKLTNIAVIVIAADDSVMPQTIESIGHAKDSGVPIIVAITKIDKPGNQIEQIKTDIAKHGLTPEDRGGDVPVIGISSKTGQGIPELLETILLQAEMLDLKYNPNRPAVGVIVDTHKNPQKGVISSAIIMTGTLKVGDIVVAYNTYGKVRRMQNRKGQSVKVISGGEPVQILGITHLPEPGRLIEVVKNEKEAQQKIALIQDQAKQNTGESAIQQFISGLKDGEKEAELRIILKSDGPSSLEATKQSIDGIQLPKKVSIKIVHSDVGHFSESDLSLAQASKSILIGFNIPVNALFKKKADNLKIEIKNYDIIYELTDYLQDLVNGMVEIEKEEVVIGKLEVLGIFYAKSKEMVVGGKVIEGKLKNKVKFRILRTDPTSKEQNIMANGEMLSLHKNKDQVKEVTEGEECGIKCHVGKKIEIGDILEFYEMQEVKEGK